MEGQGHGKQRKQHAHQYGGRKGCWHVPRTANRPFEWWAHLGIWKEARLEKSVNGTCPKKDRMCRASDLELGPKMMGDIIKDGAVIEQSDAYLLEKHQAVDVPCLQRGDRVTDPWASLSLLVRGQSPFLRG